MDNDSTVIMLSIYAIIFAILFVLAAHGVFDDDNCENYQAETEIQQIEDVEQ